MRSEVKAFGPTALVTPANALTMVRLIAAPLLAVLIVRSGPASWLLWVSWTVLASSDGLDGHLARWHGTTRSGAFLDPLADKFLVLGALAALVDLHVFSVVPVVVIGVREVAMSAYRFYAGRRGLSIPARPAAKAKTVVQVCAIGLALLPPVEHSAPWAARDVLWAAVALTVLTGAQYVRDGRRLLRSTPDGRTAVAHRTPV